MLPMILKSILPSLFPTAPAWVIGVLIDVVPEIVDIVSDLVDDPELDAEATAERVRVLLDDALDELPGWTELTEERRDTILAGLTEFALFIREQLEASGGSRRLLRKVRRHLRHKAA